MSATSFLSGKRITAYVLPAVPTAALGLPLTVYIPPLYAENTLLTLGLVGTLFSISKLIDVITDPLFGWISDRLRPIWGRRRTWVVASVPLLMVSIYQLFHPPADAGLIYLLIWLFLTYLGYTMILLAHLAWGAELARSYDDRSRIMGIRQGMASFGMLIILILPAIAEISGFVEGAAGRANLMSTFLLIMLPSTVAIAAFMVPDPLPAQLTVTTKITDLFSMFRNVHMRRVLGADILMSTATAITGSLYVWLATYVFRLPDLTSLILVIYFGSATLSVPIWMRLAVRFDKHTMFALVMFYGAAILSVFSLSQSMTMPMILFINFLYGIAFSAGVFLIRAMTADAADHDELDTGVSRMGMFYSGLTLTGKVGFALGPFIAYNFLEQMGFDPKGVVNDAAANWLLFTFIVPPALMFAAAGLLMRGHKLSRALHDEIRKTLLMRSQS